MLKFEVCLGLNLQARQLKEKKGNSNNLGKHIDNFHANVDMVTILVIRLVGKRLFDSYLRNEKWEKHKVEIT
jgi:hypothetical protein